MLVYANRFFLEPTTDLDSVLDEICRWLSSRARIDVSTESLRRNPRLKGKVGQIDSVWLTSEFPLTGAVKFTHADREVAGRRWVTDLGVRRNSEDAPVEITVLLQTNDISARVAPLETVTRPTVVRDLLAKFLALPDTPGLTELHLRTENVEVVNARVFSRDRMAPVVVVSPTAEREYLIDPDKLRSLLVGLADVVVIPLDEDAFAIRELLGFHFSAWLGAVNIIHAYTRFDELPSFRRLLPDRISSVADPESEVLSLVTHRMNLPLSWFSITTESLVRERSNRRLRAMRTELRSGNEAAEYSGLLEEELDGAESRIEELQREVQSKSGEVAFWESQAVSFEEGLREAQYTNAQLQAALASIGSAGSDSSLAGIEGSLGRALQGAATLADTLTILERVFPERLVVLETGYRSAMESAGFHFPSRAAELMWLLATDYWESLKAGVGDVEARKVFGSAYAATESETVSKRAAAMARRTFSYKGADVVMARHLKIGVKDSVAETWRCHFEWVPEDGKVVIGHCGRHLGFR